MRQADVKHYGVEERMRLRFAYLGAWHSHATMHVREAKERPEEVELLGFSDPDPEVAMLRVLVRLVVEVSLGNSSMSGPAQADDDCSSS